MGYPKATLGIRSEESKSGGKIGPMWGNFAAKKKQQHRSDSRCTNARERLTHFTKKTENTSRITERKKKKAKTERKGPDLKGAICFIHGSQNSIACS